MSVQYEPLTLSVPPLERRGAARFRFAILMPAILGRGDALILDVSAGGARVMHFTAHLRDSHVRLVFSYRGQRFSATAQMLASRVVGLGNGPRGSTSYESRLRFVECSADAASVLEAIIEQIERERLRTWVSNAAGDDAPAVGEAESGDYFLRCRFLGQRWVKCWTRDPSQPENGFAITAKLSDGELDLLCEAYERADADGRQLIRVTASMAA